MRALAIGRSALRDELIARFPSSTDAVSVAKGLSAAPLTEQAVIAYNARQPSVPLAALYVEPAPVPLDYPFAVMPGTSVDKATAAGAILGLLAGDAYRNRLATAGLRGDDGGIGAGFAAPKGAPALTAPVTAAPDPARGPNARGRRRVRLDAPSCAQRRWRIPGAGDGRGRPSGALIVRRHLGSRPLDLLLAA
jgi:hypothetical protein